MNHTGRRVRDDKTNPDFFYDISLKLSKNWDFTASSRHGSAGNWIAGDFASAANSTSNIDINAGNRRFRTAGQKTGTKANSGEQWYSRHVPRNTRSFRMDDINLGFPFNKINAGRVRCASPSGAERIRHHRLQRRRAPDTGMSAASTARSGAPLRRRCKLKQTNHENRHKTFRLGGGRKATMLAGQGSRHLPLSRPGSDLRGRLQKEQAQLPGELTNSISIRLGAGAPTCRSRRRRLGALAYPRILDGLELRPTPANAPGRAKRLGTRHECRHVVKRRPTRRLPPIYVCGRCRERRLRRQYRQTASSLTLRRPRREQQAGRQDPASRRGPFPARLFCWIATRRVRRHFAEFTAETSPFRRRCSEPKRAYSRRMCFDYCISELTDLASGRRGVPAAPLELPRRADKGAVNAAHWPAAHNAGFMPAPV